LRGKAARANQNPDDTTADVAVLVADADYEDLTLELHVTGTLPLVLLGRRELGGADCPWPDGAARGGEYELPRVVRQGNRAILLLHGATRACDVESGRLTLALRAGDGVSVVAELDVKRGVTTP
jgi:hypothetical protein